MAYNTLDARGLKCPLPVLKARRALDALDVGDRLTVLATDPVASIDLPEFCRAAGHGLVSLETDDDDTLRVCIVKGDPQPGGLAHRADKDCNIRSSEV